MIQRFIRDESGMTMALAVFMVLLIGVMGAGLLTFVMSDLQSVVEVNKGQKAMDIAEAGVQAAKAHLRLDSVRQHYDTNSTKANDCTADGARIGIENWSKALYHWEPDATNPNPGECGGAGPVSNPTDVTSTPWPEQYGVTKTFNGGRFHVAIECFDQRNDATGTSDPCDGGAGDAPIPSTSASSPEAKDTKFFKITSIGYDTSTGDGAIRKIEAVYTTSKRTYSPIAYWTPKNIRLTGGGSMNVSKMSFFAGENIAGVEGTTAGTSIANRTSPAYYGNWVSPYIPPYNTTPRVNSGGTSITGAGFGAVGYVCGSSNLGNCNAPSRSAADGINDYDSTTGYHPTTNVLCSGRSSAATPNCFNGQKKMFVAKATDPTKQITFPFDPGTALTDPSTIVDAGFLDEMRMSAVTTNSYFTPTGNFTLGSGPGSVPWPGNGFTVFVDASGGNVTYKGTGYSSGIIVVRNGNFAFNNASDPFTGIVIVIGNGTSTGTYTSTGDNQLNGYVSASGNMTIGGNVSPTLTLDQLSNLNTYFDIKLWSWRELYQ